MYLNLDLLYNVDIYLLPLFYYKKSIFYTYEIFVYCPITKKSVYQYNNYDYNYNDHITNLLKYKNNETGSFYYDIDYISEYTKCKPFFLEKKYIEYLKSNQRITKDV